VPTPDGGVKKGGGHQNCRGFWDAKRWPEAGKNGGEGSRDQKDIIRRKGASRDLLQIISHREGREI